MIKNLFYKLLALAEFLIGMFGMTVGLLFLLCVNTVGMAGLLCGILLIVFGGLSLEIGQSIVDECVEREVKTGKEL